MVGEYKPREPRTIIYGGLIYTLPHGMTREDFIKAAKTISTDVPYVVYGKKDIHGKD